MNLASLLIKAVQLHASDLHLSPSQVPIVRIEGDLIHLKEYGLLEAATIPFLILDILNDKQKLQLDKQLEIDCSVVVPNIARCRMHVFHQLHGMAAVFRIIPDTMPTIEQLHFPNIVKKLLSLSKGLILVAGSTGSGKSTTLAAMVDYMNTFYSRHVITIEDPIEFIHGSRKSLITQREIGRDTLNFNKALRSALREDPDVIVIGEMRDLDMIRLALTAAETGHLVMATLHTNSAPRAISRVVDAFPLEEKNIIRNILSASLQAVLCQTLVKRIGGGRVAAFEIMLGTDAIRNLIKEDKIVQMYSMMQTGHASGMCTLDQYLQDLAVQGWIHHESIKDTLKYPV